MRHHHTKHAWRLCTKSTCIFSAISHRTSLSYAKYGCFGSMQAIEKSDFVSLAQAPCGAACFSRYWRTSALFFVRISIILRNVCSAQLTKYQKYRVWKSRFSGGMVLIAIGIIRLKMCCVSRSCFVAVYIKNPEKETLISSFSEKTIAVRVQYTQKQLSEIFGFPAV